MSPARWSRILRQRLRSFWRRNQMDAELHRELIEHRDLLAAEYVADGMASDEAWAAAARALGNLPFLEEQCRDHRRTLWIHDLRQDVAYGARLLRRSPIFASVAILSLAVGIGANAAVLGVFGSVRRASLPFADADRLVMIRSTRVTTPDALVPATVGDYFTWLEQTNRYHSFGVSLANQRDFGADRDAGPPQRVAGSLVTPGIFATLGVQPLLGRTFLEDEAEPGRAAPVLVISYRLWQQRYGGDPEVLGREVRVDGATEQIIGVMPAGFRFPNQVAEYWAPLALDWAQPLRDGGFLVVTARLADGVSVEEAQADLDVLAARRNPPGAAGPQAWRLQVTAVRDLLYGWTTSPLLTLQVAVTLVLLITCANLAGLLLARGTARGPEMALRAALGAGRGRIVRQLLAESLLLVAAGGILGAGVAWAGVRGLGAMVPSPGGLPIPDVSLDARVLGLMMVLAVAATALFGLVPALAAGRTLGPAIDEAPRGGTGRPSRHGVRGGLVTAQIALALALLVMAGLLVNSVVRMAVRELNFDPAGLLTFQYRVPMVATLDGRPSSDQPAEADLGWDAVAATFERIEASLRTLPGVESVAGLSVPPVNSFVLPMRAIVTEGRTQPIDVVFLTVTPSYLSTMQARLLRGRDLSSDDRRGMAWVAVVNETAAGRLWPGLDPVGQRFEVAGSPDEGVREVVGVVRDMPLRSGEVEPRPAVYVPYDQLPRRPPNTNWFSARTVVLRRADDPLALVPAIREVMAEIEPDRPIANVGTIETSIGIGLLLRAYVLAVGAFALVATGLAAMGVYGVMAHAVAQRLREIGVRMALGAGRREIVVAVGQPAVILVGGGLAFGLVGAFVSSRLLASQLFGIAPTDPLTFAGMSLFLLVVALLACAIPAWRAISVDAAVVLRTE